MTIEEFLDALEQTPREWQLDGECIRRRNWNCPLHAVSGSEGMHERDKQAVICAADAARYWPRLFSPALRAQLLQRTGLVEPEHQP